MSPGIILSMFLLGSIVGVLFYTYHEGLQKGKNICNSVILAAQLKTTKEELKNIKALSEFRAKLVGEARKQVELEKIRSDKLEKTISDFPSDEYECIPDSVLSELRKLRNSN